MANNTFLPTSFTATTDFQKLSDLLSAAGIDVSAGAVAQLNGYIRNNSASINLYIGKGVTEPTYYATVAPLTAVEFLAGLNANLVWVKSASSTVAADYVEGAGSITSPTISGIVGTITLTTNQVPKADSGGNLVASSITDDGTTVTATEPVISAHATTPYFETATGKTNTGYVNIKGKTSGSMKFQPADATGQIVTIATAAQTSGACTLSIPDQAGVSSNFVFTTLAQTLVSKTLTAPVINGATSASGNFDLSGSSGTFKTSTGANTLSGAVTALDLITTVTGTTALANINTPAGTLKTTAIAGDLEYDGVNRYTTNNTTNGRAAIYADNYFRLTSTGSTISTIANYFGANSNIVLVSGGYYEIDIYAYFLKTTSGTVVWTFTNSAAPTAQDIYYEMSPVTGIVAPPGTATMLVGQVYNDATAALALTATGTLTDAVNHYMHTKIFLINGTGTSLKIQATVSAGTITPGIGSRWYCRRLPAVNTGLFAA